MTYTGLMSYDQRSSDDVRAWELSKPRLHDRPAFRLLAATIIGLTLGASAAYFLASSFS